MVDYFILGIAAVLTFIGLSYAVSKLTKDNLAKDSSSERAPMRKYTFPPVD